LPWVKYIYPISQYPPLFSEDQDEN